MMSFSICAFLRWHIYLQLPMCLIDRIMSQPNTSWLRVLFLILWYIGSNTMDAADRIFIHRSASSVYVYCRLYVHTRFTNARKFLSMIVCVCGFPGKTGFTFIPYYSSIRVFLEYLASHIVSTLMTIIVDLLSLQYVISNHPVTRVYHTNKF